MPALLRTVALVLALLSGDVYAPVYRVLVAGSGASGIRVVKFDGTTATVERSLRVTSDDTTATQDIAVAKGTTFYATAGQGTPDGRLYKIDATSGSVTAKSDALSPGVSSLDVSADGSLAYVTMNDPATMMVQGSMWVLTTSDMKAVSSFPTCMMPLGGKLAKNGALQYTACGMEDQIVEADAVARKVARRFSVAEDEEGPVDTTAAKPESEYMEGRVLVPTCSATSAQPSPRADRLWVACNRNASILEISADKWTLVRKLEAGHGPYSLAITPDGKQLLATLRQGAALEFFDAGSGKSRAKTPTSASAAQSVVVSPDGRYAFVSAAGDGTSGALDVFDVSSHQRVASVVLPGKPGVVVFWKAEP